MAYTRLAHRAQSLACFLAPALFVLAALMFIARLGPSGLFAGSAVFIDTGNKLEYAFYSYEAPLLMIPAMLALTSIVGQRLPRLGVMCTVLALFGLGTLIGVNYLNINMAIATRAGFPMTWDFFANFGEPGPSSEQLITGLPIMLYFLVNPLLGIGILRTGVLPRWLGALLFVAGLLQFDSNGPQVSGLPLLTGLLAGLCLMVVYAFVGLRLWRGEAETPIMQAQSATA
ncbi:MAG: hypothetical protein ACT4QE_14940 [Anaerolineales bacterium]